MNGLMRAIWRVKSDEEGAGAIEYAGITIVVITVIVAMVAVSGQVGSAVGSGIDRAVCVALDDCDEHTPTAPTVVEPDHPTAPIPPIAPTVEAVSVESQTVDPFGDPVVELPDGSYIPVSNHEFIDPQTGQPYEVRPHPETGEPELVAPDGTTKPLPPGAEDLLAGSEPGTSQPGDGSEPGTSDLGEGSEPGTSEPGDGSEPGTSDLGDGSEPGHGSEPGASEPGDGSDPGASDAGDGSHPDGADVDANSDPAGPDADAGADPDGSDPDGSDPDGSDPGSSDPGDGSDPTGHEVQDLIAGDLQELEGNGSPESGSGGGEGVLGTRDPDSPGNNDQGVADPVNSRTGAFVTAGVDLVRQVPGQSLVLGRSYASTDRRTGPLGRGWTHAYDVGIERDGGTTILVRAENGYRVAFDVDEGSGDISSPPGITSTLTRVDGGFELARRDGRTISFDSDGRAVEFRDPNGYTKQLEYGSDGLLRMVRSAGESISFTYDGEQLVEARLSDGRSVSYRYEGDLLVEVIDLRGNSERYRYDSDGRVERVVDNAGNLVVENTYDDDHRVIAQTDAFGFSYALTYNRDGAYDVTTYTDPRGEQHSYVYSGHRLVRFRDALGRTTDYRYDDDLNLVEIEHPNDTRTQIRYDGRGFPTRVVDAEGQRTDLRWGDNATLVQFTDAEGAESSFTYDDGGNLLTVEAPDGATTTYAYDEPGLLTEAIDPLGATTTYERDDLGQVTAVVTATDGRVELTYDDAGNVVTVIDPDGFVAGNDPGDHTWTLAWNEAHRLVALTDPLGGETNYSYDAMSRLTSVTQANGSRTVYDYDARGQLTEVVAPDGTKTRYLWDAVGNLLQRTDPTGAVTRYGYDAVGQLVGVVSPANQRWVYRYDEVGNLVEMITPEGVEADDDTTGRVEVSYDAVGRPTAVAPSDAPHVTMEWTPTGRMATMEDALGTEVLRYDDLGRLIEATRGEQSSTYDYDLVGNLIERTVDGRSTEYTYDAERRLTSVESDELSAEYSYDASGRMAESMFGNGTRTEAAWDAAGRIVKVTHRDGDDQLLDSISYGYDAAGNPREVRSMDEVLRHRYDDLDRLVQSTVVSRGTGTELAQWTYQYDDAGRRVAERGPDGGVTLLRYAAGDQLREVEHPDGSITEFEYDASGRRVAAGDDRFVFDVLDRLVEHQVDGSTFEFEHDGFGRRVSETVDGQAARSYRWDPNAPNYQLAALSGPNDPDQHLTLLPFAGTLGAHADGVTSYLHADGLGSTIATTTGDGQAGWRYGYEPFGQERSAEQLADDAPAAVLRFTGELLDESTGNYHLRLREYDPALGQFASLDPAGSFIDRPYTNQYAYVDNRPTVWTDPSGACPFCAVVGAGIGAAVGATTSIVTQVASGDDINWREVGTAAAGGAVAGGLAGLTGGASLATGALIGSGTSVIGNGVTQGLDIAFNDGSWSWGDMAFAGVTGAAGGAIAQPFGASLRAPVPRGLGMSPEGASAVVSTTMAPYNFSAGALYGIFTADGPGKTVGAVERPSPEGSGSSAPISAARSG